MNQRTQASLPKQAPDLGVRLKAPVVGLFAATLGVCACTDPEPKTSPFRSDGGVDAGVSTHGGADTQHGSSTSSGRSNVNPVPSSSSMPSTTPATTTATSSIATTGSSSLARAAITAQLATPKTSGLALQSFRAGAAAAADLASLKYFIRSIQVCESLQPQGSGFQNPMGCLELYSGDQTALQTDLNGDLTPLADEARGIESGYIDLLSESSRGTLTRSTLLEPQHVRTYNYGIITWALPIKVKATVTLGDGSNLFTHDGVTTSEIIGNDNFRNYFTRSVTSLLQAPAEEAVVLLGNGGNWFKFQQGFQVTQADLDEGRSWVLDLVFNPDGIIKGYESGYVNGNLREEDDQGTPVRGVTVPMIDLVPVAHREADHVVRESYIANIDVNGNGFDVRVELYSSEGDPNHSVLGVDVKTLVTSTTTEPPPEASKVASVGANDDATLHFGSFNGSKIIDQFARLQTVGERGHATIACATHADRAGAEGGALIVLSTCPAPALDVEFTLHSRSRLDQSIPFQTLDPDAGLESQNDAAASEQPTSGDSGTSSLDGSRSESSDSSFAPDAGGSETPNGTDAAAFPNDGASLEDIDASVDATP
jgi:hypothetical protein